MTNKRKLPRNMPETIYLQLGDDTPESFADDDFNEFREEVTWAPEPIHDADVAYIREDKVNELVDIADAKGFRRALQRR